MSKLARKVLLLLLTLGSAEVVADAKKFMGEFKVGSSYLINGKKYTPHINHSYVAEGVASWYGPSFHGKKTANGATFDKERFTAAHRTLHLPCIVRVTNLENDKSLEVLVNDRGPFKNRIIDLSYAAAAELGFATKGTARVKVEYLPHATIALLSAYPEQEKEKALLAIRTAAIKNDDLGHRKNG